MSFKGPLSPVEPSPIEPPPIEIDCALRRPRAGAPSDAESFSLDVRLRSAGGVVGLFGRSGAGKSTLLAALAGLVEPQRLRITLGGETLMDSEPGGELPPAHRRRIGMVFQDHRLFPHRTVAANLRYGMGGAPRGQRSDAPAYDEVVELLHLSGLTDRLPASCSGGERQRVALGRALLAHPRLLLLDEPLASLDRGLKRDILPFLRAARDAFDLPMIYVSHDLEEILALTEEVALIEDGRIAGHGNVASLAMDENCLELLHDCGLRFALRGVAGRRDPSGLAWITLGGGAEIAAGSWLGPVSRAGGSVDIILSPQDVILARPPLDATLSLTNRLEGRVTGIARTPQRHLVEVDCGIGQPILADVTERAVERLGLAEGTRVVALFKAQATRVRSSTSGAAAE